MKIRLIQVGKTEDSYLKEGIKKYIDKLNHYCDFEVNTLPATKGMDSQLSEKSKKKEAESIIRNVGDLDYLVLLDEKGKQFTSVEFAGYINRFGPLGDLSGFGSLTFVIGGPYGFDSSVYEKSKQLISLSKMTFSHQMIRLFFTEQLYRAFSILKKEPYHHI